MNITTNSDLQTALFWSRVMRSQEEAGASSSAVTEDTIEFQGKGTKHLHDMQCKPNLSKLIFGRLTKVRELIDCEFAKPIPKKI